MCVDKVAKYLFFQIWTLPQRGDHHLVFNQSKVVVSGGAGMGGGGGV